MARKFSKWEDRERKKGEKFFCASFFSFFKKINLFIYFWLCWVFVAAHGLSLVAASRGYSLLRCAGFSLRWLLLLQSTGSRPAGFSSCSTQAQLLWHTGLADPRHVGSSQTRAQTRVPCTGRWIPNHGATKEAPVLHSFTYCFLFLEYLSLPCLPK